MHIYAHTCINTRLHVYIYIYVHMYVYIYKQTNKQTSKQASKQANKQTQKHRNKQTNKHRNKQTNKHTHTRTHPVSELVLRFHLAGSVKAWASVLTACLRRNGWSRIASQGVRSRPRILTCGSLDGQIAAVLHKIKALVEQANHHRRISNLEWLETLNSAHKCPKTLVLKPERAPENLSLYLNCKTYNALFRPGVAAHAEAILTGRCLCGSAGRFCAFLKTGEFGV